ncbi:MAG: ABC transporter permease [Clostridia bacterium]
MKAIFKRELRAYFTSPIGYVFIGVFAFISGIYFNASILVEGYSDIDGPLGNSLLILVLLVPVLTMRLIAEEKGSKTDQLLLTAPVSVWSIVGGKLAAAMCVYFGAMVTSFPYVVIIAIHGRPVWGKILATYLGFLLLGLCFVSIGMFFSSITESQIIALIVSLGVLLALFLMTMLSSTGVAAVDKVLDLVNVIKRFYDFLNGILKLENIIYYLSISALFSFFTVRSIEKRRWS